MSGDTVTIPPLVVTKGVCNEAAFRAGVGELWRGTPIASSAGSAGTRGRGDGGQGYIRVSSLSVMQYYVNIERFSGH